MFTKLIAAFLGSETAYHTNRCPEPTCGQLLTDVMILKDINIPACPHCKTFLNTVPGATMAA